MNSFLRETLQSGINATTHCCTKGLTLINQKRRRNPVVRHIQHLQDNSRRCYSLPVESRSCSGRQCSAGQNLIGLCSINLAQNIHLSQHPSNFIINGVAGCNVCSKGTVNFKVVGVRGGWKQIKVEASVLPKVTVDLPTIPVSPVTKWKHLSGLELADPNYGIPAQVDILLGGKVFSKAVLLAEDQTSMAGGLVPPDHHQHSRRASVGY